MSIGSLCSGIGGLELGLERAGLGPVRWQCEISSFALEVLAKHWPDAVRYEDVTRLDGATLLPVRVMCFGSPCQDLSTAGWSVRPREGLDGARSGLFFACARIVEAVRPQAVVWENVLGALGRAVDIVAQRFVDLGYAVEATRIRASDLGAPHHRERVFLVAHAPPAGRSVADPVRPGSQRRGVSSGGEPAEPDECVAGGWPVDARMGGVVDGIPPGMVGVGPRGEWPARRNEAPRAWEPARTTTRDRASENYRHDRLKALGNAVSPQVAYAVGLRVREILAHAGHIPQLVPGAQA